MNNSPTARMEIDGRGTSMKIYLSALYLSIAGLGAEAATTQINPNPDKPRRLYMESDEQTPLNSQTHNHYEIYLTDQGIWRTIDQEWSFEYSHYWQDGAGGTGEGLLTYHATSTQPSSSTNGQCSRQFSGERSSG